MPKMQIERPKRWTLKDGLTTTTDKRLDRVYQRDLRSLEYGAAELVREAPIYRPRSYTWSVDEWLDQGADGACVGFAFAHDLVARPVNVLGITNNYAKELYFEFQRNDYWAGGAYPGASPFYEGTSVLAGAKVLKSMGYLDGYYWGLTTIECAMTLAYWGPFIAGVNWHSYMFDPDPDGFLRPLGYIAGGHAILVHAVKIVYKAGTMWKARTWNDVDWDKSYFTIWNSWGESWGQHGTAKITFRDFDFLLQSDGEACFPDRNPNLRQVA